MPIKCRTWTAMGCGISHPGAFATLGTGAVYGARRHGLDASHAVERDGHDLCVCDDNELLDAIAARKFDGQALKRIVVPYGTRGFSPQGLRKFAVEGYRMQQKQLLATDLTLVAYYAGWSDAHIEALYWIAPPVIGLSLHLQSRQVDIDDISASTLRKQKTITISKSVLAISIDDASKLMPSGGNLIEAKKVNIPKISGTFSSLAELIEAICDKVRYTMSSLGLQCPNIELQHEKSALRNDADFRSLGSTVRLDARLALVQKHAGLQFANLDIGANPQISWKAVLSLLRAADSFIVPSAIGQPLPAIYLGECDWDTDILQRVKTDDIVHQRVKLGRAGRDGQLRAPPVEAIELLGQTDTILPTGAYLYVHGLGEGVYVNAAQTTVGSRQHYLDFGLHEPQPVVLKVVREKLRRDLRRQHQDGQNWTVIRCPASLWTQFKQQHRGLLGQVCESLGGRWTSQIDDSDGENAISVVTATTIGCGLNDHGAAALAAALVDSPAGQVISLHTRSAADLNQNDGLSDAGFAALATAAGTCAGLVGLSLGYSQRVTEIGCKALAAALEKGRHPPQSYCTHLEFLSLSGNEKLGSRGISLLAPALTACPSLAVLELMCCGITDEGAYALGKQLLLCYELRRLDLRINPLTNFGAGKLYSFWENRAEAHHPSAESMPELTLLLDDDVATRAAEGELAFEIQDKPQWGI